MTPPQIVVTERTDADGRSVRVISIVRTEAARPCPPAPRVDEEDDERPRRSVLRGLLKT